MLVPRETPLSTIHLENLLTLRARGRRRSSSPRRASTTAPRPIDDLVDFVVGRCLDQLGVENALVKRWGAGVTPRRVPARSGRLAPERRAARCSTGSRRSTT